MKFLKYILAYFKPQVDMRTPEEIKLDAELNEELRKLRIAEKELTLYRTRQEIESKRQNLFMIQNLTPSQMQERRTSSFVL